MQRTAFQSGSHGALCLAVCLVIAGCRLPGRSAENGLAAYDKATISYDIAGCCRNLLGGDCQVTPVAYEAEGPSPQGDAADLVWKSVQLSMQYPHPDAAADMAHVTLRLSCQTPEQDLDDEQPSCPVARGVCSDELWVLDIPKGEFDQLLNQLAKLGDAPGSPPSDARLTVTINQQDMASISHREPQLDEFVKRVYQQGRLRGFIPCQQARKIPQQATRRFPTLTQSSFQFDQKL